MEERPASGPVLLCYDGSGPSRRALEHAAELLAPAPALVVHAWPALSHVLLWSPVFSAPPGPLSDAAAEIDDACRAAGRRVVDEGVEIARAAGFEAAPLLVETHHGAWRTIIGVADARDARLIVIGSHGISPIASRLLGSVAAGVTQHADRPVLMVPAERVG